MTWLVTGGAGYIGAHVARALQQAGHPVVVLDDLSTGSADRLPDDLRLLVGSVLDTTTLTNVMCRYHLSGVIHLAGKKAVSESITAPLHYYRENLEGLRSLLTAMDRAGVRRIVFSSSAAVYGTAPTPTVTEDAPTSPVSPYGRTKLAGEWMLRDAGAAQRFGWIALRYFNVAGAAAPRLADRAATNLIPSVVRAVTSGASPLIHGDDYPTPDGTCIRDYVHAADVASAHVAAAEHLMADPTAGEVLNVGRGEGSSVLEVLRTLERVSGRRLAPRVTPRRPGDCAHLVARTERIAERLHWTAQYRLEDIVRSAWTVGADGATAAASPATAANPADDLSPLVPLTEAGALR
jgi:UDP-glucose 4-epimerase